MPDPLQRLLGVRGVEGRRVVDVDEDLARDPQVGQHLVGDPLHRRQHLHPRAHLLGDEVEHLRVDPHRGLGRVGGLREQVDDLAGAHRVRVGEVEDLAVEPVLVSDVVHRLGDEVHRDDVDLLPLDADAGDPWRQQVAGALKQLEEVVGPVDLVHLAGLGVADDDPGAIDPVRDLGLLPHHGLGLVLGLEVGVVLDVVGLVEHVLGEGALVEAGRGDRADHVEALGLERLGELRAPRASPRRWRRAGTRRPRSCRRSRRGGRTRPRCPSAP